MACWLPMHSTGETEQAFVCLANWPMPLSRPIQRAGDFCWLPRKPAPYWPCWLTSNQPFPPLWAPPLWQGKLRTADQSALQYGSQPLQQRGQQRGSEPWRIRLWPKAIMLSVYMCHGQRRSLLGLGKDARNPSLCISVKGSMTTQGVGPCHIWVMYG